MYFTEDGAYYDADDERWFDSRNSYVPIKPFEGINSKIYPQTFMQLVLFYYGGGWHQMTRWVPDRKSDAVTAPAPEKHKTKAERKAERRARREARKALKEQLPEWEKQDQLWTRYMDRIMAGEVKTYQFRKEEDIGLSYTDYMNKYGAEVITPPMPTKE